jgi:hypothetical protein
MSGLDSSVSRSGRYEAVRPLKAGNGVETLLALDRSQTVDARGPESIDPD